MTVSFSDIQIAHERIAPYTHHTPVMTSRSLDLATGTTTFLKCENMQKVGAFKFRGACNAVFSLPDQVSSSIAATAAVIAHSSGNHAQALALAARLRNIPAYIVMPENAPAVKKAAVAGYVSGTAGIITFCEPTLEARESTQAEIIARTGATEVHPYNNELVIAGQGTAALELLREVPDLDVILAPVGGGGLLSGTAIAAKGINSRLRVIGAEPEMADDAYRSFKSGKWMPSINPKTIADGLLTSLGSITFPIILKNVEQIVTVSESEIIAAMRFIWERVKIIIEPSAAVPVAVLMERKLDLAGLKVGVILSGGNVDLDHLPW